MGGGGGRESSKMCKNSLFRAGWQTQRNFEAKTERGQMDYLNFCLILLSLYSRISVFSTYCIFINISFIYTFINTLNLCINTFTTKRIRSSIEFISSGTLYLGGIFCQVIDIFLPEKGIWKSWLYLYNIHIFTYWLP